MSLNRERPTIAAQHDQRLRRHVDRLPALADLIDAQDSAGLISALDEAIDFLNELLLPHMAAAEQAFYPQLERLMQNRHSMTPMRREHADIRAAIADLVVARAALSTGSFGIAEQTRLRRRIFRLYALLRVHLAEELLYAHLVEHDASEAEELALANAMEHAGSSRF